MLYEAKRGLNGLEAALEEMIALASKAIDEGYTILILSDRNVDEQMAPIPALLACSYLNSGLFKSGQRSKMSFIIESARSRGFYSIIKFMCGCIIYFISFF